jgi:hypothetical protein
MQDRAATLHAECLSLAGILALAHSPLSPRLLSPHALHTPLHLLVARRCRKAPVIFVSMYRGHFCVKKAKVLFLVNFLHVLKAGP